jgi:outer membrane protein assembly factor BamA
MRFFFIFLFSFSNLFSQTKTIEKIVLNRQEIFDTSKKEEVGWVYRAANFVHILSKENYIKRELSFKEGDPCDPLIFEESERKLRRTGLLNPVSITYEETEKGCIVYVNTRDTWTTKPGVSFNAQGGATTYSIELEENHFLGLGKNLLLSFEKEVNDRVYLLSYDDPQLFSTTLDGGFSLWNTNKGSGHSYYLSKPFDHINVEKGFDLMIFRERREFTLYWEGEKAYKFILRKNNFNLKFGKRIGFKENEAFRFYAFFERMVRDFVSDKIIVEDNPFKRDESYNFLYLGFAFEKIKAMYIKTKGLIGFTSDEDFLLGPKFLFQLGFSSPLWNGDESQLIRFSYEDGKYKNKFFWQRKIKFDLKTLDKKFYNSYFSIFSNLFYVLNQNSTFIYAFQFDGFINPNLDGVLYLGGADGQKGYKINIDTGSKRLRMTLLEKNLVFSNVLSIANIGVAFFADGGKVWGWGKSFSESDIYFDLGLGIRLEVLRSKVAKLTRIDFGYGFKEKKGFQISIASSEWFF